ncbi:patatin-like phospholipase family protein [Plasticicumulans sp.]|uniref:patatin-like phospholipase family protein n=1 Tax=Plasticicumulans sp. TaxID=2307179 RepID=UPI003956A86C
MTANPQDGIHRINIALQGGGAHGAFTWGVLDRLLEDGRLLIDGISGTSAGAMNAAVLAYGLARGGPPAARAALDEFWRRTSAAAAFSPMQPSWFDRWIGNGGMEWSPAYFVFDTLTRFFSPYQLNPMNTNPLRDVLNAVVDFDVLRRTQDVKLFLCATNVRRGRIRVFETHEIGPEAVLASACLPFLFQAVEIDGEHYWDGGYMGNPPIYPLIYGTDSRDVLIIRINPIEIVEVPRTAREIMDRVNTLSFNSSLMREMRAIGFVTRLIDEGALDPAQYKRLRIHSIDAEERMAQLGVSSKLNADWRWLCELRELGRQKAQQWLARHFGDVGVRSSTDVATMFL